MRQFTTAALCAATTLFVFSTAGARPAQPVNGGACSNCAAKLEVTQVSPGRGDITREADSTYGSWASGSVKLACDDGSLFDTVDLGLDPFELETGLDLSDVSLPAVDLQASGLSCQIEVDDGYQSAVIDVDIE